MMKPLPQVLHSVPARLAVTMLSVSLVLSLSAAAAARAARLEVNPQRAVADSFDAIPVEVLVFLDDALVPALPEDLGARVIGGAGRVQSRWLFDAPTNSWRFHFDVYPEQVGLIEVEFYHRDLDSLGAIGRFQVQVLLNENSAPARMYLVEPDDSLVRVDPTQALHMLPEGALHFLLAVDEGDIGRLSYSIRDTSDFLLEVIQAGEIVVRATREPATPGVPQLLRVRDQTGRRPDLNVTLVLHDPCLICGAPHNEDTHPSSRTAAEVIPSGEPLPPIDPPLREVADIIAFSSLNTLEPAPTYLHTTERTAIFRGRVTERLAQLDALMEYPRGKRRYFPALTIGRGEPSYFTHTFRLKPGHNRLFFVFTDVDGLERNVEFTIFREGE